MKINIKPKNKSSQILVYCTARWILLNAIECQDQDQTLETRMHVRLLTFHKRISSLASHEQRRSTFLG